MAGSCAVPTTVMMHRRSRTKSHDIKKIGTLLCNTSIQPCSGWVCIYHTLSCTYSAFLIMPHRRHVPLFAVGGTPSRGILHQCTMGVGIAKSVKKLFPAAYDANKATLKGDRSKLGTISSVKSWWSTRTHSFIGEQKASRPTMTRSVLLC